MCWNKNESSTLSLGQILGNSETFLKYDGTQPPLMINVHTPNLTVQQLIPTMVQGDEKIEQNDEEMDATQLQGSPSSTFDEAFHF